MLTSDKIITSALLSFICCGLPVPAPDDEHQEFNEPFTYRTLFDLTALKVCTIPLLLTERVSSYLTFSLSSRLFIGTTFFCCTFCYTEISFSIPSFSQGVALCAARTFLPDNYRDDRTACYDVKEQFVDAKI